MNQAEQKNRYLFSKVPEVTIFFWIIKILCTTVGETFSDFINVSLGLGLTFTTIITGCVFFVVLFLQLRAEKYVPALYWLTVVFISVFGTLVTDNLTDGIGVPLTFSTILFSALLLLTFLLWYINERTLSIHSILTRKREVFYWLTILFTFALGTAVGDLYSEELGLGYLLTGIIVASIILLVFIIWKVFKMDAVLAFWVAYIFTRPLGASFGDYLSQSTRYGGLGLGTTITSVVFLLAILAVIIVLTITKVDIKSKKSVIISESTDATNHKVFYQTIVVLGTFLVTGAGGYLWCSHNIATQTGTSLISLKGQLTDFITIETDIQKYVDEKDFSAAKSKANDLEHSWDTSAAELKSIDKTAWTNIDGTIDQVLAAVRTSNPDAAKCDTALISSLNNLNSAND